MKLVVLLLSATLLAATDPRVSIKVNPQVMMAGGSAWITCRVPRHAENRGVTIGIVDYRSSFDQIDGEAGAITHQILFNKIPCGVGDAYCDLVDNRAQHSVVRVPLQVAGCDEGSEAQGAGLGLNGR